MPLLCPDSVPDFLNFFDPSIAPPLLFYTYIPVVLLSIFIGIYVLVKANYSLVSKLLFFLSLSFSLWVLNIFIAWIAAYADSVMFSWVITPIFEILIFSSAIYFTMVFLDEKKGDIGFLAKLVIFLVCLPLLLILPTHFNISYFDLSICEGVPSNTWYFYLYAMEILAIGYVVFLCGRRYFQFGKDRTEKKKILYFGVGITSFLALFVGSNLIGQVTLIQEISFIGSIGMVIFMTLLAYLIVEFEVFSIRLFATEALVGALILLIGSQLLFVQNPTNRILTALTLVIASLIGYYLLKATHEEGKRREEAEIIAVEESRQRLEAEKLADDMKRLSEAKTEFMLSAEHNLRLPLSVIKGYLDLLYTGSFGKIGNDARKRVKSSMEVTEKLIKMVDDILDVAKYQMGKGEFKSEATDLGSLLEEIAGEFRNLAENKGLYLKFSHPKEALPMIMLDNRRLKSGLCNIVDNAIRYTEKGGIEIKVATSENDVMITIADTGIGMDEDDRRGLFLRTFERGKRAKDFHSGGKGISMYLTHQIVASQGGTIEVESEGRDKGSKFIIKIPVKKDKK